MGFLFWIQLLIQKHCRRDVAKGAHILEAEIADFWTQVSYSLAALSQASNLAFLRHNLLLGKMGTEIILLQSTPLRFKSNSVGLLHRLGKKVGIQ